MLPAWLDQAWPSFRLRRFETTTEEGRSNERKRRALLTMLANVMSKALGLAVMILSLRIALPYLGPERYGVLATIVSFSALLTFLDLGVGNALIGKVAGLGARDDAAVGALVSRAVWVLVALAIAVAAVLSVLAFYAPMAWAFKGVGMEAVEEARATMLLFALLFGASIPLGAVQKVYHGLQQGYIAHLVTAACSLAGLVVLYGLTRAHARMPAFLFVGYGMQVVSGAVLLFPLAGRLTGPRWKYFRGPETRGLLRVGGLFLLLQLGVMAGWGSDSLILSATIGPVAVVIMTVTDRVSQFIAVPLSMYNAPLWATYADALATGDRQYVRKTLRKSLGLTATAGSAIAFFLYATADYWYRLFSKNVVEVPRAVLAIYLLWMVVRSLGDCFAMYLNGVHVLRPQVYVVCAYIALSIPAKVYFGARYGLAPFVAVSVSCYFLAVALPYLTVFRRDVFRSITF